MPAASASKAANAPAANTLSTAVLKPTTPPSLIVDTVESTFKHRIIVELKDLDLADPSFYFCKDVPVPFLPDDWQVYVERSEDGAVVFGFKAVQRDVPVGSIGRNVKTKVTIFGMCRRIPGGKPERFEVARARWSNEKLSPDGTWTCLPIETTWDALKRAKPKASGPAVEREQGRYFFEVVFAGTEPLPATASSSTMAVAKAVVENLDTPTPNNVRLIFPQPSGDSLYLYTTRTILSRSPYYSTLFNSGFAEASASAPEKEPQAKKRRKSEGTAAVDSDVESDTDADKLYVKNGKPSKTLPPSNLPLLFHNITTTEACYSTYRSVLAYLSTGYFDFARLRSVCSASERKSDLLAVSKQRGGLFPSSLKSIYRLAHYLQIQELKTLALAHIRHSLTVPIVALELVSPFSLLYDEVRQTMIQYVVANYDAVEKESTYKEVMAKISRGELPNAGGVLVALLTAQREKQVKDAQKALADDSSDPGDSSDDESE